VALFHGGEISETSAVFDGVVELVKVTSGGSAERITEPEPSRMSSASDAADGQCAPAAALRE
jgi:hypothetical protein